MAACPAPSAPLGLVKSLTGAVDCHAQVLVHDGYAALFGRSLFASPLFTVVLTLWVAGLGWRLLDARGSLRLGEAPMLALKLGAVLCFATSWASYQTVVLNLAFQGPEELSARLRGVLLGPRSVYGRDVLEGLQFTFDQLTRTAAALGAKAGADAKLMAGGPALGAWGLWISAAVLVTTALGTLIVSKVALALLLALGPAFIAALLFEATRGFAVGWLRAVAGFAFAPLACTVFLTFLFALIEPLLTAITLNQRAGEFVLQPVLALTLLCVIFGAALVATLKLGASLAAGFRLPGRASATVPSIGASGATMTAAAAAPARAPLAVRERAEAVTGAALALQAHRERASSGGGERRLSISAPQLGAAHAAAGATLRAAPAYRRLGETAGSHRFQRRPA